MHDGGSSLLRERELLKFWTGQSISILGSQFTLLALPIAAAVTLGATPSEMGVLMALQAAPALVFSLIAGVWLDRVRRRPVMVASQLASAAVLATVPVAAFMHGLSMGQLYAVAFLAGVTAMFYYVAQIAFLPKLVGRERLVEANARIQTSWTVGALIGPGLAGAAVQLVTAPMAIAVDAASFLVGAATAGWLRVTESEPGRPSQHHVIREAIAGLTILWRQPLLRAITGTIVIANIGGSMSLAVFVLLFVGQIGVPPAEIGLVFGAGSLSSLLGAILIRPLQRRAGLGAAMSLSTVLLASGVLIRASAAFTLQPLTFPMLVASGIVSGFGIMTYNVPQQAIRQAVVPDQLLGRTTAGIQWLFYAGGLAGALSGGLLGQVAGLRWVLVTAAAITVLCSLPTLLSPLRSLLDVPATACS